MASLRQLAYAALVQLAVTWPALAQDAIDSVFVEVYHVEPAMEPGSAPLTTYRVFVDLAEGHELQMVYGDDAHRMFVHTTTWFANDTAHGASMAHLVKADGLNAGTPALDSWITIGMASDSHMGIPRSMDPDGSVLSCPPYSRKPDGMPSMCTTDGLVPSGTRREVMTFQLATSYLGRIRGNLLEANDGAWAVPGGVKGVSDRNIVLIGQFTTTGELSFQLNLQIETPGHEAVKYVARDPKPGEFQHSGLEHGNYRRTWAK